MKYFRMFLLPLPYPLAILVHMTYGAILASVIAAIAVGYRGYGLTYPIVGGLLGLVLSLWYAVYNRRG